VRGLPASFYPLKEVTIMPDKGGAKKDSGTAKKSGGTKTPDKTTSKPAGGKKK
jgi:hypothetical protein